MGPRVPAPCPLRYIRAGGAHGTSQRAVIAWMAQGYLDPLLRSRLSTSTSATYRHPRDPTREAEHRKARSGSLETETTDRGAKPCASIALAGLAGRCPLWPPEAPGGPVARGLLVCPVLAEKALDEATGVP